MYQHLIKMFPVLSESVLSTIAKVGSSVLVVCHLLGCKPCGHFVSYVRQAHLLAVPPIHPDSRSSQGREPAEGSFQSCLQGLRVRPFAPELMCFEPAWHPLLNLRSAAQRF